MKIFEIFSQLAGPVGKPNQPVPLFSLPERQFGYFALSVLVLGHLKLELHSICLVGFLTLLGRC